jgi:hypothetical protein
MMRDEDRLIVLHLSQLSESSREVGRRYGRMLCIAAAARFDVSPCHRPFSPVICCACFPVPDQTLPTSF